MFDALFRVSDFKGSRQIGKDKSNSISTDLTVSKPIRLPDQTQPLGLVYCPNQSEVVMEGEWFNLAHNSSNK